MKKLKKQEEFSKMLDLGKEDVANLSSESMMNVNGGITVPLPTKGTDCEQTLVYGCDTYNCASAGCTYTCICANTRICSGAACV
ncbi:MAG: hypothetical protein HXX16_15395 [Bacteroidales bacterium]|nr:hypothetical protein [Bacteroidales bacterium]